MKTILYENNDPHSVWHSVELCRRSMGASADVREVPDDHRDMSIIRNREKTKQQTEQTKNQQIRDLVQSLEEGTATSRQVQMALAHVIRKLI